MHNAGIFDLLVNINDIQALNSAINTPAGQPQGIAPSALRGTFFQLPSTIAAPPQQQQIDQAPISIDPAQLLPSLDGQGGRDIGTAVPGVERTFSTDFGMTPSAIDTAQQVLGGFGIPGLGVPTVSFGRTVSNLGALNAAEDFLGQPKTGFFGELFNPRMLTGQPSLRAVTEQTVNRALLKGNIDIAKSQQSNIARNVQRRSTFDVARPSAAPAATPSAPQRPAMQVQEDVNRQRAEREATAARNAAANRQRASTFDVGRQSERSRADREQASRSGARGPRGGIGGRSGGGSRGGGGGNTRGRAGR